MKKKLFVDWDDKQDEIYQIFIAIMFSKIENKGEAIARVFMMFEALETLEKP